MRAWYFSITSYLSRAAFIALLKVSYEDRRKYVEAGDPTARCLAIADTGRCDSVGDDCPLSIPRYAPMPRCRFLVTTVRWLMVMKRGSSRSARGAEERGLSEKVVADL